MARRVKTDTRAMINYGKMLDHTERILVNVERDMEGLTTIKKSFYTIVRRGVLIGWSCVIAVVYT